MPYLTHIASIAEVASASPSNASSQNATSTVAAAVGDVVFARVSTYKTSDGNGATNHHTAFSDEHGNTYAKLAEVSDTDADDGMCLSFWLSVITVAIPSGSTFTATYDGTKAGRCILVDTYQQPAPEEGEPSGTVELVAIATDHGKSHTMAVTLTLSEVEDVSWIATGCHSEGNTAVTLDSAFTTDHAKVVANGGTSANNTSLWGQYRLIEDITQTWDNALATGGTRHWGAILAAFRIVPPPPEPAEPGTREYQDEFETDTDVQVRTSTVRRPDAVSQDYRIAYSTGPLTIGDATTPDARRWRARVDDDNNVYLSRNDSTNSEWEDETFLFAFAGDVNEIDLCFDSLGRPVVVSERPTGTAGAPQLWIYWYDPRADLGYRQENKGNGRTPRCVLDYFPHSTSEHVCPPEIDAQIVYIKPDTGVVRLEESTYFSTEYETPLGDSDNRYLEEFLRTEGQRMSVVYSQRHPSTGRYTFHRMDSRQQADSLLLRPTFIAGSDPATDLYQSGGEYFRNPPDETVEDSYTLRVKVRQAVDGIEIQGADEFPDGSLASTDDGTVFVVQNQTVDTGFSAGGTHDFGFDVLHGDGHMSPWAFRVRCWRTIGPDTCYSPWRYILFPAQGIPPDPNDVSVNCGRDTVVDLVSWAAGGVFVAEFSRTTSVSAASDGRPFVCDDVDVPGGGPNFAGGLQNFTPSYPFPTHLQSYSVRRRAIFAVDWRDEDGRYIGTVVGTPDASRGGVVPPPAFNTPDYQYPRNFPDDAGHWPSPFGGG